MGFWIIGIIIFVAGFVLRFAPPKKINGLYGYRTSASMRSKEAWDFAQTYSGKLLMMAALIYFISYFVLNAVLKPGPDMAAAIFLPLMILCFGFVIWKVEQELKKRFR